jgi:hypothetical protein
VVHQAGALWGGEGRKTDHGDTKDTKRGVSIRNGAVGRESIACGGADLPKGVRWTDGFPFFVSFLSLW